MKKLPIYAIVLCSFITVHIGVFASQAKKTYSWREVEQAMERKKLSSNTSRILTVGITAAGITGLGYGLYTMSQKPEVKNRLLGVWDTIKSSYISSKQLFDEASPATKKVIIGSTIGIATGLLGWLGYTYVTSKNQKTSALEKLKETITEEQRERVGGAEIDGLLAAAQANPRVLVEAQNFCRELSLDQKRLLLEIMQMHTSENAL